MRGDVSFNLSFESLSIVSSGLSCSFSVTVMLLMMTRDEATAAKKARDDNEGNESLFIK